MVKAKIMVDHAVLLNARLTAQEEELTRRRAMFPDLPASALSVKATEPEEATFIRSSLAQLGLPTVAVTQDMVEDENEYHAELAKELSGVLTGKGAKSKGLMPSGEGIIGLDEVWGGWNRARGIGKRAYFERSQHR
jgi:ESCRT-II complex subunit VPS36